MPSVQRQGDTNTAGGVAQGGASSVFVNGRPMMTPGQSVSPHPCCGQRRCPPIHCNATTTGGSGTVFVEGKPVILAGDTDSCGHVRAGGSTNVLVGA